MTPTQLKRWRKENYYTQAELAGALRVDVTTISRWERGARMIPSFLYLALRNLERRKEEEK